MCCEGFSGSLLQRRDLFNQRRNTIWFRRWFSFARRGRRASAVCRPDFWFLSVLLHQEAALVVTLRAYVSDVRRRVCGERLLFLNVGANSRFLGWRLFCGARVEAAK